MSTRRLCAGVIVFNTMGNVLFGDKIKYSAWEFPGGKSDGDETVMATAIRELQEETGLVIPNPTYIGYYDRHPKWLLHVFAGLKTTYSVQPSVMEPDKHRSWEFKHPERAIDEGCTEVCEGMIKLGFVETARNAVFNPVAYEGLIARR